MPAKLSKDEWESRLVAKIANRGTMTGWANPSHYGACAKVSFRCNRDGFEWMTTPEVIMRGGWCPKCAGNVPDSNTWVTKIEAAMHGSAKFIKWVDREKTTAHSKVEMRCDSCGHTWLSEAHHLASGRGCAKCAGRVVSKAEWEHKIRDVLCGSAEFVGWASENKIGSKCRIVLKCSKKNCAHTWSPVVNEVMRGSGCPECAASERRHPEQLCIDRINASGKTEFVKWETEYRGQNSKAIVRCKDDGFEWAAAAHALISLGTGCPKCAGNRRYSKQEREAQLSEIEGVRFIKWVGCYRNYRSRVVVVCDLGHEWETRIGNLLYGSTSCPSCAKYGFDQGKSAAAYILVSECRGFVKIGISNHVAYRIATLARKTPFNFSPIEIFKFENGKDAWDLEREARSTFESAGFSGFDGATEWLKYTPALADWIASKRRHSGGIS